MGRVVWKVGELAREAGLSVRALHYYDEIGLLAPAQHTASGHRLYGAADVARLQQIKSLRQLGFSLEQIRDCLNGPDFSPLRLVESHLAHLREQVALQQRLCGKLEALAAHFRAAEEVSAEEFLQTIEAMNMIEKYYTPEQLKWLEERKHTISEERIREVEAEWPRLMAEVRAAMDRGADPASPEVQALARRWTGLVREFSGGNPEIEKALKSMWHQEQNIMGMDTAPVRELAEFIQRALAAKPAE
jgi:MerR family transcriptional regulator, thiopeptide resistance regulator